MASSPPLSTLLAAAIAILLFAATAADARLLRRVNHASTGSLCKTAGFPKLCESLTVASPTPKALAEAAIHEAIVKANAAKDAASKAQTAPGTNKRVAGSLDVCHTNFEDTADDLKQALNYISGKGTKGDIMTHLSAAVSNVETCNDAFSENDGPDSVSPIQHVTDNLEKVVTNALDLGSALK